MKTLIALILSMVMLWTPILPILIPFYTPVIYTMFTLVCSAVMKLLVQPRYWQPQPLLLLSRILHKISKAKPRCPLQPLYHTLLIDHLLIPVYTVVPRQGLHLMVPKPRPTRHRVLRKLCSFYLYHTKLLDALTNVWPPG